jgi:hypothetical protein
MTLWGKDYIESYIANEPIRGERISRSGRNGRICGGILNIDNVGINKVLQLPSKILPFESPVGDLPRMSLGSRLIGLFGRRGPGGVVCPSAAMRHRAAVRPTSLRPLWGSASRSNGEIMARDKNTYAKRERETLKRQKAEAKQERRRKRRTEFDAVEARPVPDEVSVAQG